MENSINEIDKIIREKLMGYEEDTSPFFWQRLVGKHNQSKLAGSILLLLFLISAIIFWISISESSAELKLIPNKFHDIKITEKFEPKTSFEVNDNYSKEVENEINSLKTKIIIKNERLKPYVKTKRTNTDTKSALELSETRIPQKISSLNPTRINMHNPSNKLAILLNRKIEENINLKNKNLLSRFSISIEIGQNTTWKKFESEPDYEVFKQYRAKNESSQKNSIYGFNLSYYYNNWVIKSGLNYTSIHERSKYYIKETIIDPDGGYLDIDTIWASYLDENNNLVRMIVGYNTHWVEAYKTNNYNYDYSTAYSYIEIPFIIGYGIKMRKFIFTPSVGFSVGFLISAKGKLPLSISNTFVDLNKSSIYLNKTSSNLLFNFSIEYLIHQNYSLYVKPFYNKGLKSIYTNYPLKGYYSNAGLKFGINIYF
ncbi:MAG: hypothetical protein GXO88_09395 [Chlorobi bacterium]|nr:hypothetical protein [Chlorobiota bacterium]